MVSKKDWCGNNKMAVNNGKTKSMLVTTRQKAQRLQKRNLEVNLSGTCLASVESDKVLGVTIDSHLSWKDHINKISKKVSQNIS